MNKSCLDGNTISLHHEVRLVKFINEDEEVVTRICDVIFEGGLPAKFYEVKRLTGLDKIDIACSPIRDVLDCTDRKILYEDDFGPCDKKIIDVDSYIANENDAYADIYNESDEPTIPKSSFNIGKLFVVASALFFVFALLTYLK